MDIDGKKILIVEDEEAMQKAVSEALVNQGFTTITADDGEEGIDKKLRSGRFPRGRNGSEVALDICTHTGAVPLPGERGNSFAVKRLPCLPASAPL